MPRCTNCDCWIPEEEVEDEGDPVCELCKEDDNDDDQDGEWPE